MYKTLLRLLAVFLLVFVYDSSMFAQAERTATRFFSPDRHNWVFYQGVAHGVIDVSLHDGSNKTDVQLYHGYSVIEPEVTWYSDSLVRVLMSAGGSNGFSVFYDVLHHRKSDLIWYIGAVDLINEYVLVGREEVWIQKIFSPTRRMILPYEFYNSAIKILVLETGTRFDTSGNLHLIYRNQMLQPVTKEVTAEEIRRTLGSEK